MKMLICCLAKAPSWRVMLHNSHETSDSTLAVQALQGLAGKTMVQESNFQIGYVQWHYWN